MSVQPNPIEDLKRWTLAHNPFVVYVDPWLESLWGELYDLQFRVINDMWSKEVN